MFGLFKKAPREPHPQHRMFGRMYIPISLGLDRRAGLLGALSDPEAEAVLQRSWIEFGANVLPADALLTPIGLTSSVFRHEKFLCFLIIFPTPQASGEAHFGFIVAGPSDDWSPEARAQVAVRYFILERSLDDATTILEWGQQSPEDANDFEILGPGPSATHPPDFANSILARFYDYHPTA